MGRKLRVEKMSYNILALCSVSFFLSLGYDTLNDDSIALRETFVIALQSLVRYIPLNNLSVRRDARNIISVTYKMLRMEHKQVCATG